MAKLPQLTGTLVLMKEKPIKKDKIEAAATPYSLLRTIQKTFDAMLVFGAYILMVILLLAPYIINLIAGSAFAAAATPLKFLAPAVFLIFLNLTISSVLIAAKKFNKLIQRNIFLLFVNIILNLILISYLS